VKKLLLITILIGGCATTVPQYATNDIEQEGICKIDYRDQYWGDCYIRAIKADPNFSKVRAFIKRNYPSSNMQYNLLHRLNEDLLKRLAGNVITIDEANKSFKTRLDRSRSVTDREFTTVAREKEEERQKAALAWQQLGEALNQANTTLNQNNPNANNSNDSRGGMLHTLSDHYMSGRNRICIYKMGGNIATHTMNGARMCPATMRF